MHTELKSSFNDAVIELLVGFDNTNSGRVMIDVDNEGMPWKSFITRGETVQQWLNEIKNKTQLPEFLYQIK